jgi:hypothetical protein
MHDQAANDVEKREIESVMLSNFSRGAIRKSRAIYRRLKGEGRLISVNGKIKPEPKFRSNRRMVAEHASYFVECELPNSMAYVKIGEIRGTRVVFTIRGKMLERLRSLQCGNPIKLTLVGMSADLESDIHRQWSHIRACGEWFEKSKELAEWMKLNVVPWEEILTWSNQLTFQKNVSLFLRCTRERNVNGTT